MANDGHIVLRSISAKAFLLLYFIHDLKVVATDVC